MPLPDMALVTDHDGRFTLAAPAPGAYTLRGDTDTHGSVQQVLQAQGQAMQVTLRLPR